jgi:DNA polymerase III epsilon subunit-like protein
MGANMTYIMVDVETDGPIPADFSMICFGAVIVDDFLDKTFYGQLCPISEKWIPESLKISGFTREQTLQFDDPKEVMNKFNNWIKSNSKDNLMFISDNNGFDWQFINYYFHHFLGENPFGHSSTNLGSLHKGLVKDTFQNFKHLRKTTHTHNPVDDVIGNAEALLYMKKEMGLKISL